MNLLGMGPMELMLIMVLALIVLGPGKLPEVLGQLGRGVRDFRRATSELSEEFNRTIQSEINETKAAIEGTPSPSTQTASLPAPILTTAPPAPPFTAEQANGVTEGGYPEPTAIGTILPPSTPDVTSPPDAEKTNGAVEGRLPEPAAPSTLLPPATPDISSSPPVAQADDATEGRLPESAAPSTPLPRHSAAAPPPPAADRHTPETEATATAAPGG